MKNIAIVIGLLLIVVGVVGYFTSPVEVREGPQPDAEIVEEKRSWTALIPAIVGLPILLCGIWASVSPAATKNAMHIAAGIGLLGALAATGRGVGSLLSFIRADDDFNQRAFVYLCLMGAFCWIFVITCVVSFAKARKTRDDSTPAQPSGDA